MRVPALASIRTRLVLLVLLGVLPALGLLLFTGTSLRQSMVRSAESTALRQVQSMATHHERVVDMARLLLSTLASARPVVQQDSRLCRQLLEETRVRDGLFAALALADIDGTVVAAAPEGYFATVRDTSGFQIALRERRFAMGAYHLAQPGQVVMNFAQPVTDSAGAVQGVLLASFDLSYFGQIFEAAHLPEGSVFTLTDATGMRLTRFPETRKYTWVPDLPQMVARMSGGEQEGTFLETGVDGVRRLYSFKRLRIADAPFPYLMIRLGQPEDLALGEVRRVVALGWWGLVLGAGMAVAVAWLVGEFAVVRRLNRLVAAAERLGMGDLGSRTGLPHDSGELGVLATSFDRMAEGLEHNDGERRRAEEEICHLNSELEERVCQRTAALQTALLDLRQAQRQLVLSEKLAALGELVAGVAHEINTPVGVALSATSTMAERNRVLRDLFASGEMKRSDLTEYLESVREGAEMALLNLHRASDLIRSFKMVAADQVSESRRAFNCREYVGQVLLSLRPKLKKTPHSVEVDCPADLVVESYPGALSQILTNFIINSLTHAFAPDQAGHLRIAIARETDLLHLTYADDGRGMTPEVQRKIFEPFYTTARSRGSTGLGLHIVFNIVTRTLGGTISCESEPGRGTTFHVRFPLHPETA